MSLKQITDGTSNTIMVGEKHVPMGTFGQGPLDSSIYNGGTYSPFRAGGIYYPLAVSDYDYSWKFGSYHTGICQFVFVDGSVHALSTGIDLVTLGRLADRADGQVLGNWE